MNRRDFTRLSALTLAATRIPAQETRPVGYAAVGLGTISDIFMRSVQQSPGSRITALVTGHPDTKGVKYAEQYGIPKSSIYTYETYDRIRDNPAVDAVYIGLPNSMHCEYTVRAAKAGKHVLCEKPMAISSAECRQMIDACKAADRKLMIAYRVHYDPTWNHAAEIIRSGALGQMMSFRGSFLGNFAAGQWRLDKKFAGGGPMMDLGIYPLNGIRFLTGEEPSAYTATVSTRHTGKYIGMEESIEWTMKFPSGIVASCGTSYGQDSLSFLDVSGDRGSLQMGSCFNYNGMHLQGGGSGQHFDETSSGKHPYQFTLEADHFSNCIRTNSQPKTAGDEGLKDMLAIEAIYKAAGTPIA